MGVLDCSFLITFLPLLSSISDINAIIYELNTSG